MPGTPRIFCLLLLLRTISLYNYSFYFIVITKLFFELSFFFVIIHFSCSVFSYFREKSHLYFCSLEELLIVEDVSIFFGSPIAEDALFGALLSVGFLEVFFLSADIAIAILNNNLEITHFRIK